MKWLWPLAGAALVGLLALERQLDSETTATEVVGVAPLVDPATSKLFDGDVERRVPVAALTLTRPGLDGRPESFFYARSKGVWRCLNRFGLVASEARIVDLLQGIYLTRTLAHPSSESLDGYGLGPDQRVRIELHGVGVEVDRETLSAARTAGADDVLFALDLGHSLDRGGAFARPEGRGPALLLDRDLGRGLRADQSLAAPLTGFRTPPLVDPHLIPVAWPPLVSGIERVVVNRPDGSGFDLVRTELRTEPGQGPSVPLYRLTDADGGPTTDAHPALTTGYTLFLARAPYERPRDPREVSSTAQVDTYVTVFGVGDEEPLQLAILTAGIGRTRTVLNSWTGSAYEVSDEVARLLAPDPEQLTNPALGIAWDAYLR